MSNTTLGERLKEARNAAGLSHADAAAAVGTHRQVIYNIESGHRKDPAFSTVAKLAAAYNLSLDTLASETIMSHSHYAIVTAGYATIGEAKSYYRSLESAKRDAMELGGGTLTTVRIVGASSAKEAKTADISGPLPVVWTR